MNNRQRKASAQAERERRRSLVAQLLVLRPTLMEMVRALASEGIVVSHTTVAKDVKLVEKRYLEEQSQHINTIRARELAELAYMESQLATAWSSSAGKVETVTYDSAGVVLKRVVEQRGPNPAYMAQRLQVKKQRASILGLNAPENHNHQMVNFVVEVGK
mgnify:CR=1 FL=1